MASLGIIGRIQSVEADGDPSPFQPPPASPVDNAYFGAAPFAFGADQVMRFRLRPLAPGSEAPDIDDPDYLANALRERLADDAAGPVAFAFEAQIRPAASLDPATDIENAHQGWDEKEHTIHRLAELTIPPQAIDTEEATEACERLVFKPWIGLAAHRPLGGINRLRRPVYNASSDARGQANP